MFNMGALFTSLGRTVSAGIVLLILIVVGAAALNGQSIKIDHAYATVIMRWLHVVCGIMWVGLLWYLNFVQVPTMPKIQPAESRSAITKFIAPTVLWWFRYAALATVITGLLVALMQPDGVGYLTRAFTLRSPQVMIGIGMWMALIMAFNVWFIIWPNQQKILGLVEATAEEKAAAAPRALYASRFNTMFSIGMLYCMLAQQNAPI
jgi:uncharacterized membrane protein